MGLRSISIFVTIAIFGIAACATNPTAPPKTTPLAKDNGAATLINQGNQFAKEGLLREAVEAYKKGLQKDPSNMAAHRNLGIVLLKAGDAESAITNLEKSIDEYDDNFEANFYLGEAYRATDKYAEAIFRYKKALKIQNNDIRAMKSLAWSYHKIRFYSEALNVAQQILKVTPSDEQTPIILARTLIKLKRENDAIATLRRGLDRAGKEAQPYYLSVIAEALAAQGKTDDALDYWRKSLKLQPMLAGALLGSGQALLALGRKKEAAENLERAVRLKPKMYEGHYWLARSLEESDPGRALRYYQSFRKHGANDPEFLELVQDTKKRSASLKTKKEMELNSN